MPRTRKTTPTYSATSVGASLPALTKELWQAAVNLRGSIEPADYKRYVLPLIFLRFLSLRYERRRGEFEKRLLSVIQAEVKCEIPDWAEGPFRNGAYDPVLDDGVKVNITLLQEAGVLRYGKVV